MKKLFIAALLAITVAGSTFAADLKKLNAAILSSDKSEFAKAGSISGNKQTAGPGNSKGLTIGNDEDTTLNQLPVPAKRTFAKMFDGYNVKQAIHFTEAEGEVFYISAENEKESIIVKIDDELNISIFKKIKKS